MSHSRAIPDDDTQSAGLFGTPQQGLQQANVQAGHVTRHDQVQVAATALKGGFNAPQGTEARSRVDDALKAEVLIPLRHSDQSHATGGNGNLMRYVYDERVRAGREKRLILAHARAKSPDKHEPGGLHAQIVTPGTDFPVIMRTNEVRPFVMSFCRLTGRSQDGKFSADEEGYEAGPAVVLAPWQRRFQLRFPQMFPLPRIISLAALAVAQTLFHTADAQTVGPPRVEAVRFWSFGDVTRIAIQTQGTYRLTWDQVERPARVYFDLNGLRPPSSAHRGVQTIAVGDRRVKQIRVAEVSPGRTRLVFDLEGPAEVISSPLVNPDRLMIEIRPRGSSLPALSAGRHPTAPISTAGNTTASQRVDLASNEGTAIESDARTAAPAPTDRPLSTSRVTTIQTADGLIVQQVYTPPKPVAPPISGVAPRRANSTSVGSGAAPRVPASSATLIPPPGPARTAISSSKVIRVAAPAKKDSAGARSLVRVFGLKMGKVVIDAGHGGHDTGTIGPNGLMEKDLVLDVALRLGALITEQLGAQVVYTRSDDTFVPLEQRTKVANNEKADLFISIHANSSPEPSASGVETYFFNLTSDKSGLDLATRENATSASAISDLNDMLHRAVLQAKLEESREFAQSVQSSLWACSVKMDNHSRDRGVRQAPFVVLIGAIMPSILAEIGFVSNPHDEKMLRRSEERERIAAALFKGVSQYAGTLSHLDIASAGSR